jgi:hypothetical protein
MPTYEIKGPNGKTYQIEGPEGASQSEIEAEVMRQNAADFQQPKPSTPAQPRGQSPTAPAPQQPAMQQPEAAAPDMLPEDDIDARIMEKFGSFEAYQNFVAENGVAAGTRALGLEETAVQEEAPGAYSAPSEAAPEQRRMTNEQARLQIMGMMRDKAPPDAILKLIDEQGLQISDADRKWLTGPYTRGSKRAVTVPPDTETRPKTGRAEATWKGLQSGALFGFDDEIAGLSGAVGNKIGNFLGMNETNADFWDVYEAVRRDQVDRKDRAWEDRPGFYAGGFVPGMMLGPSFLKGSGQGGRATARDYAAAGGVSGGISGAGNSEPGMENRALGALVGIPTGYTFGAVTKPAVSIAKDVGQRVYQRVRPSDNNLNSGLDALAIRADLDAPAMQARAAELEALGVPPRLLDLVGEEGRGVISAATQRTTGASDDLVKAADDVYVDAQDRIARQARDRIAPGSENIGARQIAEATETLRDATVREQMEAIRSTPVPITDEVMEVLSTREGAAALRAAQGLMTEPAERAAVDSVLSAIKQINKLDPRLPEAARKQISAQIMGETRLTVDMADKFHRAMKGRGAKTPGLERVTGQFARTVRDAAKQVSPEYRKVMDDYETAYRVVEAAQGKGRFEETDILRSDPRTFANAVDEADDIRPNFIDEDGFTTQGATPQEAIRARAADTIASRAQESGGQNALAVGRQLSRGSNQAQRNEALLGPNAARSLEEAMAAEVARVDNTRFVDPRIGSKTARVLREREEAGAGVVGDVVQAAAFSVPFTIARAVGKWLNNVGIKDVDAERLVRDAIDPERTNDALAYLVQKGLPKNEARTVLRFIQNKRHGSFGAPAAGRAAGEIAGNERPTNPRSVRMLNVVRRVTEPKVDRSQVTRVELDRN